MELHIRFAEPADIPVLVTLMQGFYGEGDYPLDAAWAARSFGALLAHPERGHVFLAQDGNQPVGYVVLVLRHCMDSGGLSGVIDDLYVEPDWRGRGVGSALMRELVADCERRGMTSLHVEVGGDNTAALALYRKFGLHVLTDGRVLMERSLAGKESA